MANFSDQIAGKPTAPVSTSRPVKAQHFDTIVIGGGLTGLLVAHCLQRLHGSQQNGQTVALIEAMDSFGGHSRSGQTKIGAIDYGLKVIPDSNEARSALEWLSGILGEDLSLKAVEAQPVNYDEGRFKPYVGFGNDTVATAGEIEAYALNHRLELGKTPKDWVAKLSELYQGARFPLSTVTKLTLEGQKITELLVNGAKRFTADRFIFAGSPQALPALLGDTALPPRVRQKLLKGEFWTSVNLDLIHAAPITDSQSVHILKGANEEPTVGLFHAAQPSADGRLIQLSQWTTLIAREDTDDEELVGSALKQIKRQLKRAYESASHDILQERILVIPSSHGDLTHAFEKPGRIPKIDNLWLTSAFFQKSKNTIGALIQARIVIDELLSLLVEAPNASSADFGAVSEGLLIV